jgi:hydroxyacylglutathione hydrolase
MKHPISSSKAFQLPAAEIVRVPILPFGMVNCHLLLGEHASILIDTGLPGSESKILRALRRRGRTLRDLSLIVVTHAHVDHAGSAARLREMSGAPIIAHASDLDFYEQRRKMTFCATGSFGRLFLKTGLILQPYAPFTPDILLRSGQSYDLLAHGFRGQIYSTPGHTAGSISVRLDDSGDALVGDLLASGVLLGGIIRTGSAIRPPFEDDPHAVATELEALLHSGSKSFYMGHGGPLTAQEVSRHAARLRRLPCRCLWPSAADGDVQIK